ncbi:MAG: NnrU family protein [Kordiimonas sp.]
MTLLAAGLALFFLLHMIPFWGQKLRTGTIAKLGKGPYSGLFALISLGSFVLIVLGWQASEVELLYSPPEWGRHATPLFALIGIVLFIASNAPTNIRRLLRHPQLTGVALWAIGHLFSNGETRSVLLFSGMVIFSITAIIASNNRDGEWIKRDPVPKSRDVVTVAIGLSVFSALYYFHEYFTGIPVLP